MSGNELEQSLALLEQQWEVDPLLKEFVLGGVTDVADHRSVVGGVVFHIPYLRTHGKYVLWKCYWPDCHNCCERQGRLPLTSDDLITIGAGLKYSKVSEFVNNETVAATWQEPGAGGLSTITAINLKRSPDETESEDGTRIPCRFLDDAGSCTMHPGRPGVCYLYPFTTWLENENGRAKVHATYQFTGDCPGFYLADGVSDMDQTLSEYSEIIYDYNMSYARTLREGFGAVSLGPSS